CVVEGAIPTRDGGVYCKIGGRTALQMLEQVADGAAAIIAIGSCASFGGLPAAEPNPTGAKGVRDVLAGKQIVNLPGCPANPYNFLGVVLQLATFGTLPTLDDQGRPAFAYRRTIHEDCPRRAHFDAGRFADAYGDEAHREGYCLYKLGCKGPQTHANCALKRFGETSAWPIGIGHPCIGCTEKSLLFRAPIHATVPIDQPTSNVGTPPVRAETPPLNPAATGVGGLIVGGLIGAGVMVSRRLNAAYRGDGEEARDGD
ncbi:MAG: hydrogenase small subunit, partial [Myxococcota bacterium]